MEKRLRKPAKKSVRELEENWSLVKSRSRAISLHILSYWSVYIYYILPKQDLVFNKLASAALIKILRLPLTRLSFFLKREEIVEVDKFTCNSPGSHKCFSVW